MMIRRLSAHQLAQRRSTPKADRPLSTQAGLTLLEAVMAILVIGITGVMITPPIMLATATRVQNRRAEQASQLAQGEIDRIRTLVEQGGHEMRFLPEDVGVLPNLENYTYPTLPGNPTAFTVMRSTNPAYDTTIQLEDEWIIPANEAMGVDVTGNGEADFFVQSFISNVQFNATQQRNPDAAERLPLQLDVGVRVYAVADPDLGKQQDQMANDYGAEGNEVVPASLRFTTGEGSIRSRPLAVFYSTITWSDTTESSLCGYHGVCN